MERSWLEADRIHLRISNLYFAGIIIRVQLAPHGQS